MASWKDTEIIIDGVPVKAQAPIIISASRSTDIPAFYADWFFDKLEQGYSAWTNPFSGVKSYVSYKNTRFIVFWSKNPRPLIPYLSILKEKDIKCYIQYTLNDYEREHLEKVPSLANRIETFKMLVQELGAGSVVWRFDPMILTDNITIDDLLKKVKCIGDALKGYTEKLVFSYADITAYKKVKYNLEKSGILYHEWTENHMEEFALKLSQMNRECGWNYQLATCSEKIDIDKFGILHNRCIDADLITRLAWNDKVLMDFMKVKIQPMPTPSLFDEGEVLLPEGAIKLPHNQYFVSVHKKDPGQRALCGCMAAKDIGEYNTCPHLCEYCYANTTKQLAVDNWKRHQQNKNSDTITGK
ncbi:DUF1848 domain-containing protein [Bacteroides pyogenes]|uniref:DUF1848 domain-containing protein n=1 Tax=Bacteroides pyogenes TaxID=310300 RepID=UPI002A823E4F|nr:DUF1848 domain-containing protein [Bacteroides pyogenes]MDY4250429.1 DUF1848 domain-containing protein [Bacteroides pyogenes]